MAKLIILSVVFMSFGVPVWLSTSLKPRRALRRVQAIIVIYILIWALMCLQWYPAIVPLK